MEPLRFEPGGWSGWRRHGAATVPQRGISRLVLVTPPWPICHTRGGCN